MGVLPAPPQGGVSGMEPLSGVGPLRPGWARAWVSLRREAPLSGCYLGCCVLAAARVLLRWSVCTRVALAEKAQAACRRRWPLARTWGLGGIAGLPVWIQAAALSGEILFPANLAICTKSRNAAVSGGLSSSRSRQWRRSWVPKKLGAHPFGAATGATAVLIWGVKDD